MGAMPNRSHVMIRLSQYAVAWASAFLVVLALALAGRFLLHLDTIRSVDALLGLALILLGLLVVAGVAATLISKQSLATKVAVSVLAVLLLLPLLWSPVLAAVLTAKLTGVSIEYSGVYAGFRITVSRFLYALFQGGGAAVETIWPVFETVATILGFAASVLELMRLLRRRPSA
jgi:hypothetical protein